LRLKRGTEFGRGENRLADPRRMKKVRHVLGGVQDRHLVFRVGNITGKKRGGDYPNQILIIGRQSGRFNGAGLPEAEKDSAYDVEGGRRYGGYRSGEREKTKEKCRNRLRRKWNEHF